MAPATTGRRRHRPPPSPYHLKGLKRPTHTTHIESGPHTCMVVGCLPTTRPPKRGHVRMTQRTTLSQDSKRLKKRARSQATMNRGTTMTKAIRMQEGAAITQALEARQGREDNARSQATMNRSTTVAKAIRMEEGAGTTQTLEARQGREDNARHQTRKGSATMTKAIRVQEGAEITQALEARQGHENNTSRRPNYNAKWKN